ncbi:uncharacterized protein LOC124500018 [Dermatophagoides farinae]|uniref:uncharacterized protein LOC124500018 n=1 Tax=Dermatophagoides farinae TaxID=6954 RepID=UPI003F5EC4B7
MNTNIHHQQQSSSTNQWIRQLLEQCVSNDKKQSSSSNVVDHHQISSINNRGGIVLNQRINYLISILIFFILINIMLIGWIIISLNLHQNSQTFIRTTTTKSITTNNNQNDDPKLRIKGNLYSGDGNNNCTLYTNDINHYKSQMAQSTINNQHLRLQFQSNPTGEMNPSGDVQIRSNDDGNGMNVNSLHLSAITGNLEFKINNRLVIESEKPSRRLLQIENDGLIIEDSSTSMAYIRQQPGGLRLSQMMTDSIVGCVNQDLRIESRTEQLSIKSTNSSIQMESNNGPIQIKSYDDLWFNTEQLSLNGRNILFANLNRNHHHHNHHREQQHHIRHGHNNRHNENNDDHGPILAYQVCMCTNGQIFAAEETIPCQADHNICGSHNE